MSVWNPDNIKDVAESLGIANLSDEVANSVSRDVEYRLSQVLEEALKLMRHSKRTTLFTSDISAALRMLEVEPLYGYESTRPLRFGEALHGTQTLLYVEDEDVDFEKLINAPLPKVPREISFTAHWLAVEGVQPLIPQNPTATESRALELLPKTSSLAASSADSNVTVKPLVKHILSQELQHYFTKVTTAIYVSQPGDEMYNDAEAAEDDANSLRAAAYTSLRSDPGLHQLLPYFMQFIAEKVTHTQTDLETLERTLHLISALLDNNTLYLDPYVVSIVPPVITVLLGRRLGTTQSQLPTYALRALASSLLARLCQKFSTSTKNLKARIARSCLKYFLHPENPLAVQVAAVRTLAALGGEDTVRTLIVPNLKIWGDLVRDKEANASSSEEEEIELVKKLVGDVLENAVRDAALLQDGMDDDSVESDLKEKVGDFWTTVLLSRAGDSSRWKALWA